MSSDVLDWEYEILRRDSRGRRITRPDGGKGLILQNKFYFVDDDNQVISPPFSNVEYIDDEKYAVTYDGWDGKINGVLETGNLPSDSYQEHNEVQERAVEHLDKGSAKGAGIAKEMSVRSLLSRQGKTGIIWSKVKTKLDDQLI